MPWLDRPSATRGEHLAFRGRSAHGGVPAGGARLIRRAHDRWVEHAFALGDALAGRQPGRRCLIRVP